MPPRKRRTLVMVPPAPAADPARVCLERVATLASRTLDMAVGLAPQRDGALAWKAVAVHPLQALETEYQGIVRDSARGISDPDQHKAVESKEMGRFFLFDAGTPRLLGVAPGEAYEGMRFPMLEDRLRDATLWQRRAARAIADASDGAAVDSRAVGAALLEGWRQAWAVHQGFFTMPRAVPVPRLDEARRQLHGLDRAIAEAMSWDDYAASANRLSRGIGQLERALQGLSSVQMFYVIEGFYLYRLLVRYRIDSDTAISAEDIAKASGQLTSIVNDGQGWLGDWIRDKLLTLMERLQAVDASGDTRFFLKGGRAIAYLEGRPKNGKSDWDTQILINPDLPAAQWYDLFQRVHNAVLLSLKDFKTELYTLLYEKVPAFQAHLDAIEGAIEGAIPVPGGDDAPDPIDAPEPPATDLELPVPGGPSAQRANCKAELIDIGLPRYDTVEAREQWVQLRDGILRSPDDGMPYPGYLYYINEYLMMIREVFTGTSPSMRKAPKRIERLHQILTSTDPRLAAAIEGEDGHASLAKRLPRSVAAVKAQPDQAAGRALIVLLDQFLEAYGLDADPGFAASFDGFFAEALPDAATHATYPSGLTDAIDELGARKQDWLDACKPLTDAIGFGHWVSAAMEEHLVRRAGFMRENRTALDGLLRDVTSLLSDREELELQMAVSGSLAAHLQADYVEFARREALDPLDAVTVGLYTRTPAARPAEVLAIVAPRVADHVAAHQDLFTLEESADGTAIRVYWASIADIPPFKYRPLVFTLSVAGAVEGWPRLSHIWGNPVLGLRDLIRAYQRRSAVVEEFGRRGRLRETTQALIEILTRAENPEPTDRDAAEAKRCHHLMISSEDYVNGPAADYPPNCYPDRAWRIGMTGNRPELKRRLTLPPSAGDRTLDLLVVNQGHGGWKLFSEARWTAADLKTFLVDPMVASGLRAHIVVLDFCLSASLLGTFAPLCAAGGRIFAGVYSITAILMTKELWAGIRPALERRDRTAVLHAIEERLAACAADGTGQVHADPVRHMSEEALAAHLARHPGDRDAISAFRCLWRIGEALRNPDMPLPDAHAELLALKWSPLPWDNIGPEEASILRLLPNAAAAFTAGVRAGMVRAVRRRVEAILTDPAYRIGLDPAALAAVPLFGPASPNLWEMMIGDRTRLLALARGLRRCPTAFALFDSGTRALTVDAALVGSPIAGEVRALLDRLDETAAADAVRTLEELKTSGVVQTFDPVADYGQG